MSENFKKLNASLDDFNGFPSSMIEGSYDLNGKRMHSYNRIVIATGRRRRRNAALPGPVHGDRLRRQGPGGGARHRGDHQGLQRRPRSSRRPRPRLGCARHELDGPPPTCPPSPDAPSIVTGANSGLGEVTARELARVGAKVILAVRNTDKGDAAAAGMTGDVEVRKLDLQDLASVRAFADGVDAVDVLVNNAGIMAVPYAQTVDGFESQIGTNHLGHFALTNLLLPKITDRVVTVSSVMHLIGYISLKDLNWKSRPYFAWPAYGQSKLANLLFTSELQRRLDAAGSPLKAHAAHPGYSATNLQGNTGNADRHEVFKVVTPLVATDADFGARQTLYAVSQDLPGDSFIGPRFAMRGPTGQTFRSPLARDAKKAAALWELSEQLTGTKFAL